MKKYMYIYGFASLVFLLEKLKAEERYEECEEIKEALESQSFPTEYGEDIENSLHDMWNSVTGGFGGPFNPCRYRENASKIYCLITNA